MLSNPFKTMTDINESLVRFYAKHMLSNPFKTMTDINESLVRFFIEILEWTHNYEMGKVIY